MNGGPIGPRKGPKLVTKYRWEMTPAEIAAVAHGMLAESARLQGHAAHVEISLDDLIAKYAPNAEKIAHLAPADQPPPEA